MSKKYLSNDPDCMAEAARRFRTLFGHWPEFIGVNRKNAETCRGSIKFPMLEDYIDKLMWFKPGIDDELPQAIPITMQEIPIKPYDGAGFYDFVLWSEKTRAVTPELVLNVNGYTVIKMIEALGYCCHNYSVGPTGDDYFTIQHNHLYINLALSRFEYEHPEDLKQFLENRVKRKFNEAKKQYEKAPEHANCKCSKEATKKPYIKVTIYNGDFTQEMFFDKCSIHTDSNDTTFQASSFKYSVIDPVKE